MSERRTVELVPMQASLRHEPVHQIPKPLIVKALDQGERLVDQDVLEAGRRLLDQSQFTPGRYGNLFSASARNTIADAVICSM